MLAGCWFPVFALSELRPGRLDTGFGLEAIKIPNSKSMRRSPDKKR
jgi:hypothetical protein